jgi:hypothetical protein
MYLTTVSSGGSLSERDMALAIGILPALRFLTFEETRSFPTYEDTCSFEKDVPAPMRLRNPLRNRRPTDRLSNSPIKKDLFAFKGDYSCKSCCQELFNSFFRCSKCTKDVDICRQCHSEQAATSKSKGKSKKACMHINVCQRKRFIDDDVGMKGLLVKLQAVVGDKSVRYADETVLRLKVANGNPNDTGLQDEVALLLKKDQAARAPSEMVDAFSP